MTAEQMNVLVGICILIPFLGLLGFVFAKEARADKYERYKHLMLATKNVDRVEHRIFMDAMHALAPYLGLKSIAIGIVEENEDDELSLILEYHWWVKLWPGYMQLLKNEAIYIRRRNPEIKTINLTQEIVNIEPQEDAI